MKNIILVVLYNEIITESQTFTSLVKAFLNKKGMADNYTVLFWDNSTAEVNKNYIDKALVSIKEVGLAAKYVNTPENIALSKIYNRVINEFIEERDYLFILDQDSDFDEGYFSSFHNITSKNNPDIILPIVNFKEQIVSPTKVFYLKGFYYKKAPHGFISNRNVSAINSGMIVSFSYIKKKTFRYNEKLRNYCTDDDIMQFVRKNETTVYVMDYAFEHDLSLCTLNLNSDSLRNRYNEMVRSKKILYSRNIVENIFVGLYFTIHRIYMATKYKDAKYLKG